jgi:hypothetical protein
MVRTYRISLDRRRVCRADASTAATGGQHRHPDRHTPPISHPYPYRDADHHADADTDRRATQYH